MSVRARVCVCVCYFARLYRVRYQSAEFEFAAGQLMDSISLSFDFGAVPYASISARDPAQKRVGPVRFDAGFDLSDPASQTWMLAFCVALSSPELAPRAGASVHVHDFTHTTHVFARLEETQ